MVMFKWSENQIIYRYDKEQSTLPLSLLKVHCLVSCATAGIPNTQCFMSLVQECVSMATLVCVYGPSDKELDYRHLVVLDWLIS